jgi:uncharacterized membrane protein YfcA
MDPAFIALNIAVLSAAALQSATGIGFGIIAGPIMLAVLNDASAIHVSILLNLFIAGLLTPTLLHNVDKALLGTLALGLLIGTPFGIWAFLAMNIESLKLAAALAVMLTLALTVRSHRKPATRTPTEAGNAERGLMGALAGLMGGSLAIPGPIPAAWMSANGYGKDAIRATILAMFVLSYSISLGLQLGMTGIGRETFFLALTLVPSTLGGIAAGRLLHRRLTEDVFRRMLLVVLAATVVLLIATLV